MATSKTSGPLADHHRKSDGYRVAVMLSAAKVLPHAATEMLGCAQHDTPVTATVVDYWQGGLSWLPALCGLQRFRTNRYPSPSHRRVVPGEACRAVGPRRPARHSDPQVGCNVTRAHMPGSRSAAGAGGVGGADAVGSAGAATEP